MSGRGTSSEDSQRSWHLEAPKAKAGGLRRRLEGQGRRNRRREAARSGPEEGRGLPTRSTQGLRALVRSHPA